MTNGYNGPPTHEDPGDSVHHQMADNLLFQVDRLMSGAVNEDIDLTDPEIQEVVRTASTGGSVMALEAIAHALLAIDYTLRIGLVHDESAHQVADGTPGRSSDDA